MAQNKTQASAASPDAYVAAIAEAPRRHDCEALMALMSRATGQPPVMWGSSIVGFGVRRYALAGGKWGEICAVGFSSRKGDISIYGLSAGEEATGLLARLGRHKLGKGCLYVRCLADIDQTVLQTLVEQAATRHEP